MPTATATAPIVLTTANVRTVASWTGVEYLLVPDRIAARMEAERLNGWREFIGYGWGESRIFMQGTWMYAAIEVLMAVYAATPVSEHLVGSNDRRAALFRRELAANGEELRVPVVGFGDWDDSARDWRDRSGNAHLHVFGNAHRHFEGAAFRLAG
ncbi:hypothetical protein [Actinoplanes sp. URMC 104]|uniref:hypothetical protein n=1 Tax=Actinoplanes sp. URMC 104 TaxID=3423409 RepID=UPI003F1C69BE